MDTTHLRAVPEGGSNEGERTASAARTPGRSRPQRGLPTDRIAFGTQLKMLTTLGRLSGYARNAVTAVQLGEAMNMSPATAALCNRFFMDMHWVDRKAKGEYAATDALLEFTNRSGLSSDDARLHAATLAPPMRQSWAWETISPLIEKGPVRRDEALVCLARDAGAAAHHKEMLSNVIAWMEYVGLVKSDDQIIMLASSTSTEEEAPVDLEASTPDGTPAETNVSGATTRQPGDAPAGIVLSYSFSVNWTADDIARLAPEQIKALFEAMGTLAAAGK